MMKKLEGEVSDVLEYHVDGDEDYGTLTCGADNDAEGEAQPCTFLITPSVRWEGETVRVKPPQSLKFNFKDNSSALNAISTLLLYFYDNGQRQKRCFWHLN